MLLKCPSCNNQYLINSADLQPEGNMVQCAECEYQWFQNKNIHLDDNHNKEKQSSSDKIYTKSLPSPYIEIRKTSYTNTFLLLFVIFIILFFYYSSKNLDEGIFNLIKYYISEIIIYTNIVVDELSSVVFEILN